MSCYRIESRLAALERRRPPLDPDPSHWSLEDVMLAWELTPPEEQARIDQQAEQELQAWQAARRRAP